MTITDFQAFDLYKYFPDIDNDRYYNYRVRKKNKLIRGAKYVLKGLECDGFQMPERVYQVVALVSKVNDVELDSVVMRQLRGFEDDTKYTLTKQECQVLHIKYEPGLQLFPAKMLWKKFNDRIESGRTFFDESDMSTYPVSRIDSTIRHIILKVDRFQVEGNYVIDTDKDKRYMIDSFLTSMRITSKGNLVSHRDAISAGMSLFKKEESLPFRIIIGDTKTNGLTDGDLYVEVYLKKPVKGCTTEDGITGIPPRLFVGKKITDILNVYVDEFKLGKKAISAIKHYQSKTGIEITIPCSSFIGSTFDILNNNDMHRKNIHVGDMLFDPFKSELHLQTSDGIWTVSNGMKCIINKS